MRRGGGARIERKHPINDVDEIVSIVLPSILHAFPKKDNPSSSRMARNGWIDGWMDMDGRGQDVVT